MAKSLDPGTSIFAGKSASAPRVVKPVIKGKLPLQMGEVILTDKERKTVEKLGFKPGMVLPGDISERIKAAQQKLQDEASTLKPKPDDFKPQIPNTVDIDTLTEVERQRLSEYIEEFQRQAPMIEQAVKQGARFSELTPAAQRAVLDASDLNESGVTDIQSLIDNAERGDDQEEATPPAREETISIIDRMNYITAIQAGTPFRKTYKLLGGAIEFTFKYMTTAEIDRVVTEMSSRLKFDSLSPIQTERTGKAWITILSLANAVVGQKSYSFSIKDDESLEGAYQRLISEPPLNSGHTWQLCLQYCDAFEQLTSELESRAEDADFWKAIDG